MLCLYKVIDYNASHSWLESPQKEVFSLNGNQSKRPTVQSGPSMRVGRFSASIEVAGAMIWISGMEAYYCPWAVARV